MDISEAFKLLKAGKIVRHKLWKHAICLQLDILHAPFMRPYNMIKVLVAKWILEANDMEEILSSFMIESIPYTVIGGVRAEMPREDIKHVIDLISQNCKHLVLLSKVFQFHPLNFNDDGWEVIE